MVDELHLAIFLMIAGAGALDQGLGRVFVVFVSLFRAPRRPELCGSHIRGYRQLYQQLARGYSQVERPPMRLCRPGARRMPGGRVGCRQRE